LEVFMRRLVLVCAALVLLDPLAWAGVVVQMEVTAKDAPERTGSEVFYAQGEMTRTDSPSTSGQASSVIFRDETMYFVDHDKKVCQKIDKQDVEQLSGQLGAMMKEMEKLPPEQRAMMEKMMKGKMPGAQAPPTQRVETGGREQVGDYPCTVHTLYSDDEKVREVCLADESVGADLGEAMAAFQALARFAEGLMEVTRNLPFGDSIEIPFQDVQGMNGFPVRTRVFDGEGQVVLERTLKSITRRGLEPEEFEIPKGYKVKSLEGELRKGAKR
jgi:hypothetical protein